MIYNNTILSIETFVERQQDAMNDRSTTTENSTTIRVFNGEIRPIMEIRNCAAHNMSSSNNNNTTKTRQRRRRQHRRRIYNDFLLMLILLTISIGKHTPLLSYRNYSTYRYSDLAIVNAWQQQQRPLLAAFYHHSIRTKSFINYKLHLLHTNVHLRKPIINNRNHHTYSTYLKQRLRGDGQEKHDNDDDYNDDRGRKNDNNMENVRVRNDNINKSGNDLTHKQRIDNNSNTSKSRSRKRNHWDTSSKKASTGDPASTITNSLLPPLQPPPLNPAAIPSKGSKKSNPGNTNQSKPDGATGSSKVNNQRGGSVKSIHSKQKKTSSFETTKRPNSRSSSSGTGGAGFGKDVQQPSATTKASSIPPLPTIKKKASLPPTTTYKGETYTSLLPPYIVPDNVASTNINNNVDNQDDVNEDDDDDDFVASGLSSWEQFLSRGPSITSVNRNNINGEVGYLSKQQSPDISESNDPEIRIIESVLREFPPIQQQPLPSIDDLFPPDITSKLVSGKGQKRDGNITPAQSSKSNSTYSTTMSTGSNRKGAGGSILDGIIPVSDLFYRSSQAQYGDDEEHDDEELPFSAEQSDSITSDENKVRVRQNMADKEQVLLQQQQQQLNPRKDTDAKTSIVNTTSSVSPLKEKDTKEISRKMIRRGMEMLVGGVPIQADPPQRSVQITYNQPPKDGLSGYDWASTISLNTREFGPLLHTESIPKVSEFERGLFCEYFCHAAIKWDVCPSDLRKIVSSHKAAIRLSKDAVSLENNDEKIKEKATNVIASLTKASRSDSETQESAVEDSSDNSFIGTNGEIRFEIGISREELETGSMDSDGSAIFRTVFAKAFHTILERAINVSATKRLWDNVEVEIPRLILQETDDGYTSVCAEFKVDANFTSSDADKELRSSKIGTAFSRAMDDGSFAIAIAAAAKDEMRWPEEVRNRVVEECLFQDDDGDESTEKMHWTRTDSPVMYDQEVGLVIPARLGDGRSSLYKGGGTDGVFYDFSAMNALNAPYSGELGLRLVDAVTERAKQRHPKVIAIGDVHGCIDELQDLLRQCDYRPGDLVVFLGDLVCKGPDSIAVVQMAREIGAIAVRGNHDFEVVRWHQAIKSGVDPPIFGSEHYHIAACLSKADMNWMHSLPWYISSKDLGTLFVHAGFVSGIRLAKQNPRLMMNMRSILPDGTVTSKFFNNWPWARLWDGPQTVLFGHDADRGLQQYEHAIGLDTGCVYGGRLTACILPEKKLVSVSAKREYFKYRRKHYD